MNPRASYPTYSLSRGAPSPLGYFSMVKTKNSIIIKKWRRGRDSNSWSLAGSLVFKTSSLNHSDISPYCRLSYATIYFIPFFQPFVKIFLNFFQTFSKFCKFILFPPPHALKKHSRSNSVCTNYARQKVRLSVCNPLFS